MVNQSDSWIKKKRLKVCQNIFPVREFVGFQTTNYKIQRAVSVCEFYHKMLKIRALGATGNECMHKDANHWKNAVQID